jgi:hypothetical protein
MSLVVLGEDGLGHHLVNLETRCSPSKLRPRSLLAVHVHKATGLYRNCAQKSARLKLRGSYLLIDLRLTE